MGVHQETPASGWDSVPSKCKEKTEGNPVLLPQEKGNRALSFRLKSSKLRSHGPNLGYRGGTKKNQINSPKVFTPSKEF